MKQWFGILIFALLGTSFSKQEKYLKVPAEGIKTIQLVLKDQFSGSVIEKYVLDQSNYTPFLADLNSSEEAPKLKMNITCYRFDVLYQDGRKIQLSTNGKGIGPTPVGYFICAENLILKYFPVTKEKYCKPMNGGKPAKNNIGF